jgi:hypothetical protein
MDMTTQTQSYNAKNLDSTQRRQLALDAMNPSISVTDLSDQHKVSRKFVHQQKNKAAKAVNDSFDTGDKKKGEVLFYLPVTFAWLCQFILCLVFHCRANHRGIQKLLRDTFDHEISFGAIHNIIEDAKSKAKTLNEQQDLSNIKLAAQDEMFHYNKPVLTGIDIPSLYCYLLRAEKDREFDTWGTHLLDLKDRGLSPDRVFGDDAKAIRAAHKYVFPETPYDLDNYHIIQEMMDMRRFFRNKLKSAITKRKDFKIKVDKNIVKKNLVTYHDQLEDAIRKEQAAKQLSQSIDTLVSWMQHDVLNMPGVAPEDRYALFDFILDELNQLAKEHPHRIKDVCTTLTNQKYYLLAFTEVLNEKFQEIADKYVYPIEKIWAMCELQRCQHGSDRYAIRSLPLQDYFDVEFDEIEDAVLQALDSTERTSSMVENLHSRLRPYFYLRREIGFGYLDLLQFYLNHTPFERSAKAQRRHKSPAEILNGKPHKNWLEMLGYCRFKKAS